MKEKKLEGEAFVFFSILPSLLFPYLHLCILCSVGGGFEYSFDSCFDFYLLAVLIFFKANK
jgi:hypothetical protein